MRPCGAPLHAHSANNLTLRHKLVLFDEHLGLMQIGRDQALAVI